MEIAIIFALVTVPANIFLIWYSKRRYRKAKTDGSSNLKNDSYSYSKGNLNTPDVMQLKQSAAAELSISVEKLDRMSAEEITQLAMKKNMINPG